MTGERTRRAVLRAGATLTAGLAGCSLPESRGPFGFEEGFESGLGGWERGATVPSAEDAWRVVATDERSATGFRSARYDLGADGSAWLHRRIDIDPGASYEASVAATVQGSAGDLVLFLDSTWPATGGPFPPPDDADAGLRESLARDAWRTHALTRTTPPVEAGALHVAVGITTAGSGGATAYVDDVKGTFLRRSTSD